MTDSASFDNHQTDIEKTITEAMKRYCANPRKYCEGSNKDTLKPRPDDLGRAFDHDLHKFMFNMDAFMECRKKLPDTDTKYNWIKPLCHALKAATDEREAQEAREAEMAKATGEEPKKKRRKTLTEEEKQNWIHLRELLDWFTRTEADIIKIVEKIRKWWEDESKRVYLWVWLELGLATSRTARIDVVDLKWRNGDMQKDAILDVEHKTILIREANKTGRTDDVNYNVNVGKLCMF
ncbi:hypothetical protein HDV00_006963 [Rhizophlyctis rosea]|nr:hypothetical protein HDV00_006963 [Rhizophlyctis rosea]